MTDRERWTVYPLLFLALGVTLRDKITATIETHDVVAKNIVMTDVVEADSIRCREISVLGVDDRPRIRLGESRQDSGKIEVLGRSGERALELATESDGRTGKVVVYLPGGVPAKIEAIPRKAPAAR